MVAVQVKLPSPGEEEGGGGGEGGKVTGIYSIPPPSPQHANNRGGGGIKLSKITCENTKQIPNNMELAFFALVVF